MPQRDTVSLILDFSIINPHTHPREETCREAKWKQLQCDFLGIEQHLEVVLLVVEPALRPDSEFIKLQYVYGIKAT